MEAGLCLVRFFSDGRFTEAPESPVEQEELGTFIHHRSLEFCIHYHTVAFQRCRSRVYDRSQRRLLLFLVCGAVGRCGTLCADDRRV